MPESTVDQQKLNQAVLDIIQTALPHREQMKRLVNQECNRAMMETTKLDGFYLISRTVAHAFLTYSGLSLQQIETLASFMPGGFVMKNPFYNTLLAYVLTFCAEGEIDDVVYTIAKYFTAIKLSYAKKKYFPFIDVNLMTYTLVHSHGNAVVKQGWGPFIEKVSRETLNKYINTFKTTVVINSYYRYMVDIHNKVNQSMKHVARRYYSNHGKVLDTSGADLLNKALDALDKVINSNEAVDFLSRYTAINDYEVERILVRLRAVLDDDANFQNIISRIITQYKDRDGINKIGITAAAGRVILMTGVQENSNQLLTRMGLVPSKDYTRLIIYTAILCIMYSSANQQAASID